MVVVIGDKFGEKKMVVMEPDMQHRMPWYDRYEASSGNFLAKEDLKSYLILKSSNKIAINADVYTKCLHNNLQLWQYLLYSLKHIGKNILSVCYFRGLLALK